MSHTRFSFILLAAFFFCTLRAIAVIYVSPSGNDVNDGRSWQRSKLSVRAALSAAAAAYPIEEVWIAVGSYTISVPIEMKEGVNVYGGFLGVENSIAERPPIVLGDTSRSNLTKISGLGKTAILMQLSAFNATTIWNGISFIRGNSPVHGGAVSIQRGGELQFCNVMYSETQQMGGGVACLEGGSIVNCYIAYNKAAEAGGGLFLNSAKISNSVIMKNHAKLNGGGVYSPYKGIIQRSRFIGNVTEGSGGAVYSNEGKVLYSAFIENTAAQGYGGGIYSDGAAILITDTAIENIARYGGGIYLSDRVLVDSCQINLNKSALDGAGIFASNGGVVKNSIIDSNNAKGEGAGIFTKKGAIRIENTTVTRNIATGNGGGIYSHSSTYLVHSTISQNRSSGNGGGAFLFAKGVIDSSIFNKNTATFGGGIYCGTSTINSCELIENRSTESGGGVYLLDLSVVSQCTLSNNTAQKEGGAIYASLDNHLDRLYVANNKSQGLGGGIFLEKNNIATNLIVANNQSVNGGGMYAQYENKVIGATIVRNSAGTGGGITFLTDGELTNSIIWGNTNQIYKPGSLRETYCAIESLEPTSHKSNIQLSRLNENTFDTLLNAPYFTQPTISTGPTSEDIFAVDWRLQANSPCIDKGFNDAVLSTGAREFSGLPRIYDYGIVDMGAYEWSHPGYTNITTIKRKKEVKVFPNPAQGMITIDASFEIKRVLAYSVMGTLLYEFTTINNNMIDVTPLLRGVIILYVEGQRQVATARLIKE
ncbi:MAG: choice-of-anchor Q domain-containing protein [Bacteroidales bacterium]